MPSECFRVRLRGDTQLYERRRVNGAPSIRACLPRVLQAAALSNCISHEQTMTCSCSPQKLTVTQNGAESSSIKVVCSLHCSSCKV